MRAKWRALKSGWGSVPQKVLDRGDVVRDGRIVAVPSLWTRPGGVLQQHGLGVHRPSEANTFVNTCRLIRTNNGNGGTPLLPVRQLSSTTKWAPIKPTTIGLTCM